MADTAQTKSPAKKRPSKAKKPSSHPKYSDMIRKAINTLAERGGSSRQAIAKYICSNYKVDSDKVRNHLKLALRAGIKNKTLKQCKGTGASGSFKLGDKSEKKAKKPKAKKAKKAKKPKAAGAKKVRKPKAAGAKKSPKKARKPKAAKKSPKKTAKPKAVKKSPAKKAAKSKKAKSPKKAKK